MYDIQRAENITMPASLGAQSSTLSLTIDGETYQYAVVNGDLQLSADSQTDVLNGSLTQISAITFQRFGNIGGKHAIRVNFTIDSRNETAAGEESKQIETMIGLR